MVVFCLAPGAVRRLDGCNLGFLFQSIGRQRSELCFVKLQHQFHVIQRGSVLDPELDLDLRYLVEQGVVAGCIQNARRHLVQKRVLEARIGQEESQLFCSLPVALPPLEYLRDILCGLALVGVGQLPVQGLLFLQATRLVGKHDLEQDCFDLCDPPCTQVGRE